MYQLQSNLQPLILSFYNTHIIVNFMNLQKFTNFYKS